MSHVDLWQRLDALLWNRGTRAIRITEVKGHATSDDVRSGKVLQRDKMGNDRADVLAVAGAAANAQNGNNREAYREKLTFTISAQCLMLDILAACKLARREASTPSNSSSSSSSSLRP